MPGDDIGVFGVGQHVEGLIVEGIVLVPVGPADQVLAVDAVEAEIVLYEMDGDHPAVAVDEFHVAAGLGQQPCRGCADHPAHARQVVAV